MIEPQLGGVQRWSGHSKCVSSASVPRIADDRVMDCLEVYANLVGSSRIEFAGEKADLGILPAS